VKRSGSRKLFARDQRRLVPAIQSSDLAPGGSGVRAQAVDRAGNLLDDFVIVEAHRQTHVVNAPSPAATASLAIGREIAAGVLRALA
jgi:L-2-hydroxyglutarate oxidase